MRDGIRIFLVAMLLFCRPLSLLAAAEEDPFADLSGVQDPFLSKLPPPEIIETDVEQPGKMGNNNNMPNGPQTRNPTVIKDVVLPKFKLQGLVWDSEHPESIVEGKVLGIGDKVQGAEIRTIGKEGLGLLYEGKQFQVKMDE